MMMNHPDVMGKDAMLAGLKEFIATYQNGPDFPLLQDFVAVMRTHATNLPAFDAFTKQWFERVVLPEFKLRDVVVTGPVGEPPVWTTTATIANVGTGLVTIDVGAMKAKIAGDEKPQERVLTQVTLGPDGTAESTKAIEIKSPFDPESVVVDPNVCMLQTRRKLATWKK